MLFPSLFFSLSMAHAIPQQFNHQGRLTDTDGNGLEGEHELQFILLDDEFGGTTWWNETFSLGLVNGYYSVTLGDDEDNPLDDTVFSQAPLWLEMRLDGTALQPRHLITATPYASMAQVSEELDGGTVNASEVSVNNIPVIDADGNWVGPSAATDWSALQSIPPDIADGDDNTDTLAGLSCATDEVAIWSGSAWVCAPDSVLDEAAVELFVTNDALDLHISTTIDGMAILTAVDDADTLGGLSCLSDGDVAIWDDALQEWFCDSLTLIQLSESEVETYVTNDSIDLAAGSSMDGSPLVTEADITAPDWGDVQNRPAGLDDGDDDTLASTACGDGEVLVYSLTTSAWDCGQDSDTTLTASEVQAMVEAVSGLALQTGATVDGSLVLTETSEIDPNQLSATTASDAQVLTYSAGTIAWADAGSGSSCDEAMISHSDGSFYVTVDCGTYSYILKTGGATNFWSSPNTCTISFIEYPPNGVHSLIDCGTSIHVISGSHQSDITATSLINEGHYANSHHCAIVTDGSVECWGDNSHDQADDIPSGTFTSLSSGYIHICGLRPDDSVECWGYDGYGQVTSTPSGSFTQLSSGYYFTCGITTSGSVECWGYNNHGQVSGTPSGSFTQLSSGEYHICGITTSGSVECWGHDSYGQVSDTPSGSFTQLSSGYYHTCGITTSGSVECWGDGAIGTVPSGSFTQLSSGYSHTCGLISSGDVLCWGNDSDPQVSDTPSGTFTQLTSGDYFTCGITSTSTMTCWGNEFYLDHTPSNGQWESIHASAHSACGILDTGNVICWGVSSDGQTSPP